MLPSTAKERETQTTLAARQRGAYNPDSFRAGPVLKDRFRSGTNSTPFQVFHWFAPPSGQGTIPRSIGACGPSGFVEGPSRKQISTIGSVANDRLTEKL